MAKWGHNLPAVLNPEGDICVNVKIPNHPDYVKLFLRAVRMLEVNRMYERDEELSAKIVVDQWRNRTLTPLVEALAQGTGCPEDMNEFDCIGFPAYAGFIEYVPDNPFDPNAPIPNNYLTHAWWRWGELNTVLPDWIDNPINDFLEFATGYRNNDAITWLGSLPYNGIGEIIDNQFPFPYIKIHVTGSGSAKIKFLSFPIGGRIIVEVDEIPNIIDILSSSFLDPDSLVIDTDRDVTSFPMEQWPEIIIEVPVEGEGDHIIYCMLISRVNDGADFFGFGGGLRGIELCNGLRPINTPPPELPPPLEGVEELRPEFQFTSECGLEYRLRDQENNIVQGWTAVEGWTNNAAACFTPEGGGMATIEEICQAIECGLEKAAARYLSGTSANLLGGTIEINDGNEITVVPPGQAPDDTTSSADEEDRSGGASGIRLGINLIWANLSSWYVGGISEATAAERLKVMYELNNDQVDLLVSHYYFQRGAAAPYVSSFASTLDGYLYCKGTSIQTVFRWIYEIQPSNLQVGSTLLGQSLTQNQLNYWFNQGKLTPSTDYADYSCTKTPSETVDVDVDSNTYYAGVQIWKVNHRIRLTVSGFAVDAQGDRLDFWWNKSSAGVLTFKNNDTRIEINGQEQEDATQNEVPFNEAGAYSWTFISQHTGGIRFRVNRGVGIDLALENTFSVLVEDLGEIIT